MALGHKAAWPRRDECATVRDQCMMVREAYAWGGQKWRFKKADAVDDILIQ